MPTYVYACPKCGGKLELLLTVSEYTTNPLPMCAAEGCDGQQTMKPQIQASALVFKGTGWTPKFGKKE